MLITLTDVCIYPNTQRKQINQRKCFDAESDIYISGGHGYDHPPHSHCHVQLSEFINEKS